MEMDNVDRLQTILILLVAAAMKVMTTAWRQIDCVSNRTAEQRAQRPEEQHRYLHGIRSGLDDMEAVEI